MHNFLIQHFMALPTLCVYVDSEREAILHDRIDPLQPQGFYASLTQRVRGGNNIMMQL